MRRLAAWYLTGPIGHLVAGVADVAGMFARWQWSRARARWTSASGG
jgi:drug/metabolite transporter superfamily protein YnfA